MSTPEGGTETIGLRDAAEQLGVHYMTAYRYVRSGRLDAHKQAGEWRVSPGDVATLAAEPGAGSGPSPGAGEDVPRQVHRRRLEKRLVAGDEAGAWGVVESAMASGALPAEVLTEMLAPSLRSIGERWAAGQLSIADEHRASAVSQRLIARLGPRFSRPGRRRASVVLGSAAGDRHSLPTAIMSDLLRGEGLDVVDLGADCPAESFLDAAAATGDVAAIGVCVTSDELLDDARSVFAAIRAASLPCPLVAGGGAVTSEEVASSLGADRWASSPDAAVALFRELADAARHRP